MALSDPLSYYDRNIPCLAACPVHTNAGAYVAAIADGDDLAAFLTARLPNPFPSVCGRVCAAPCESACRRGELDQPIAIRALKRFVTEQYGVESGHSAWGNVIAPTTAQRTESIGIVGGGPAGMACAHDLLLHGYQVAVYEATGQLGGMMRHGIPEYRLDRSLLDAELEAIVGLGAEVHLNTRLGEDVTFDELKSRHDAMFVAIGASLGRGLAIEGADADGVLRAIEFLLNVNRGFHVDIGDRVIVIGGGDVAMDAARTALRRADYAAAAIETNEIDRSMTEAIDAARTAAREGATDVLVIALESEEEMPASPFELEEARAENIRFVHRQGPNRILVDGGRVAGLETVGVRSVFDDNGRFAPEFDRDALSEHEADTVILAIGQAVDVDALGDEGPPVSPWRTITIDEETMRTRVDGVWAGGDAAHAPRSLIEAIADGRRAAADMHRNLSGEDAEARRGGQLVELAQFHRLDDTYDRVDRLTVPSLPTDRRIGLAEVETGFSPEQARCEASRCLRCFANIQLDVNACVLCGLCVDVCPYDLISMVPAGEVAPGVPGTALLLDETSCIRCALCIERCPTNALSMSTWVGVGALDSPVLARSAVS
jgi:formate dehydrogenase (NADP+) beta subunit